MCNTFLICVTCVEQRTNLKPNILEIKIYTRGGTITMRRIHSRFVDGYFPVKRYETSTSNNSN